MNQMAAPGQSFREFYESVGRLYPEEDLVYGTLRGMVRQKFVLSYLRGFKGKLLDLGCNRGTYTAYYENGTALGVDLAFSVLLTAKRRYPACDFIQGDAQNLSFLRPDSFDVILCSEMIEHVPNPEEVVSECFRVLVPGGTLLVTTPNHRGKKPTWIDVGRMREYGVKGMKKEAYFHTAFRPEELQSMVENVGFCVEDCGTFEKEVKYSSRIPVIFYHITSIINKSTIKSRYIERINSLMLERSSLFIYKVCCVLGLSQPLTRLVKEGVRSYVLATKLDYSILPP